MTPAHVRGNRSTAMRYTFADSPVGPLLVAVTDKGLRQVHIGSDEDALLARLHKDHANIAVTSDRSGLVEVADCIIRQLSGEKPDDIPLDIPATDFQRLVWLELRAIPYGDTRTYSEIARRMGRPDSVRAVAGACAANRVAIVIPCHRVLRDDGGLGGYRWGNEHKTQLLEYERRQRGGAGIRDGGQMSLGIDS